MHWRNTDDQYGLIAQILHWLIVGLVIWQFVLGWRAEDLPVSMARLQLLATHKALGMTVLMVMLLRLAWRLLDGAPAIPPSRTRLLAQITHYAFYMVLIAVPMSGWLLSSASNLSVNYFRLFTFPDLVGSSEELAGLFKLAHEALTTSLALLIGLHVSAALLHQFYFRDSLIRRMLPVRVRE